MTAAYRHVRRHFDAIMGGDIEPIVKANFLTSTALPSWLTLTRTGHATMFDSSGYLTFAPNNLILHSNDWSQAQWNNYGTLTVTPGVSDPDGGTNATTLTALGVNASTTQTYTAVAGISMMHSVWVRRRTGTGNVALYTPAGGANTISVTSTWTRYSVKGDPGGATGYFIILLAVSGDEIDVYHAQAERVTYETSPRTYNATTSAQYYGPRFDYNPATLDARGLLIEGSRKNWFPVSENFSDGVNWPLSNLTIGATTSAPNGVSSAYLVYPASTGSNRRFTAGSTSCPTGVNTQSICLKYSGIRYVYVFKGDGSAVALWIDTQNAAYGTVASGYITYPPVALANGFYRYSWTTPSLATTFCGYIGLSSADNSQNVTANGTDGVYFWGAQLEEGAFPTSYIPTTAGAVLRNAETVSSTDASVLLNKGTIVLESESPAVGDAWSYGPVAAGTYLSQYEIGSSANVAWFVDLEAIGSWAADTVYRAAIAFDSAGNVKGSVDGGAVASSALSDYTGSPTHLYLANRAGGARPTNGHIRYFAAYNSMLSDSQLILKSTLTSSVTTGFLLENGTDFLLLESGDYLLQE